MGPCERSAAVGASWAFAGGKGCSRQQPTRMRRLRHSPSSTGSGRVEGNDELEVSERRPVTLAAAPALPESSTQALRVHGWRIFLNRD